MGYVVGNQARAEMLLPHYATRSFEPIIRYCKTAQVFQDAPFSWPDTYRYLNEAYPESLFILTIRDNADQWYQSLINFQSRKFGKGRVPTQSDLKNAMYRYKGFMWEANQTVYGAPVDCPYKKEVLIDSYENHNRDVLNYFGADNERLLVINLGERGSYSKFCDFLKIKKTKTSFYWENRTIK